MFNLEGIYCVCLFRLLSDFTNDISGVKIKLNVNKGNTEGSDVKKRLCL